MKSNERLQAILTTLAGFVLAPLVMAGAVLGWATAVQLTCAFAMGAAAYAPRISARLRRRR